MSEDANYWNELYEDVGDSEVPWIETDFIDQHIDFFKTFKNKHCLCVADGTGDNGLKLSKLGINVTATDISTVAIKKARKRAKEQNLTNYQIIETDSLEFDFQKKFDLIVGIKIQFTTEYSKIHSQMKKILKEKGAICIFGFHPDHLKLGERGPPIKELMYTCDDLKKDFEGFKVLEALDYIKEYQNKSGVKKQHLISFIAEDC